MNLLLDDSAGDEIFRQWINAREGAATSFNSHRIFIPTRLYERQFVLDAALDVANGLLPRDTDTQVLLAGSADDRRRDAEDILSTELFALFRILKEPDTEKGAPGSIGSDEIPRSSSMICSASRIRWACLAAPSARDKEMAASRLFADIFEAFRPFAMSRKNSTITKERVQAEVALRRRDYDGDGIGGVQGIGGVDPPVDRRAHPNLHRLIVSAST